ncbi:hypothetical protein PR048_017621 [Dryococelus australis]|uniref:Uncharacterized protein n=1 Tax=Dryococelus australis TaxID=614101 RepID=A0ABQ9HA31_9NEOP|nr:hypothetical protein PR048_017621 [Dryococelus australis]
MSAKSVTAESDGSPSKASVGAEGPVFSIRTVQYQKVSLKLNITHQVLQETNDSANPTSPILPAANECLQLQIAAVPDRKSPQSEIPAKQQDQETAGPRDSRTKRQPFLEAILCNDQSDSKYKCVLVKRQKSRNKGKQSTEVIYINSKTDTLAGVTDTDEDDTGA